jgi:predicted nucleotidyltransferase
MFLPYPPEIWTSPNNLLAIEYLKALHYLDSKLEPLTIKREGSFHSKEMDTSFASASAIRETLLKTKSPKEVEVGQQIPKESLPYLSDTLMEWEDFYDFLSLKIVENWPQLTQYTDVSEELARRIQKIFNECCSMAELSEKLKTKQYTYTRIQRSLLHILLGITKEMSSEYKNAGYMPYARVLGFKKEKADFFKELKQKSQIPLVTKMTAFTHPLLELEIKASSLYELAVKNKYQCRNRKNEYNQGVIIF